MAERKPVVLVGGQLKELPADDTLPAQAPATHSHPTSDVTGLDAALNAKLSDAPSDGRQYARKDAAWAEVVSGGGGASTGDIVLSSSALTIPEYLPCDGSTYLQSSYPELYAKIGLLPTIGDKWVASGNSGSVRTAAANASVFVVAGGSANLRYSSDGISWSTATTTFTGSETIYKVVFAGGKFVAVGDTGKVAASADGSNWSTGSSGTASERLYDVTYGNGVWVEVGSTKYIASGTNGSSYTPRTSNFPIGNIFAVAYGAGVFVAAGDYGYVVTSTDGTTWTSRGLLFTESIVSLVFGNGVFVALGINGNLYSSTDGLTWVARGQYLYASASGGHSLSFLEGIFFAACGGTLAISRDGIGWEIVPPPAATYAASMGGPAFKSGVFVMPSTSGVYRSGKYSYSTATQFVTPKIDPVVIGNLRYFIKA